MISLAALAHHHEAPSLGLILALIVLGILYVAWRTRRLSRLGTRFGVARLRRELRDERISPFALLPLVVLVAVIVALLITQR